MMIAPEALLTEAARFGHFGRFQSEAAIQSVHVQRPTTGQLNLTALRTLDDLLVEQTGGLGAQIGSAVVLAEGGDPKPAADVLGALPTDRVARQQPRWIARAGVAALAGNPTLQKECLRHAIDFTEDADIRTFHENQDVALA